MTNPLKFLLGFLILTMLASCKKSDDPSATTSDEYLTCSIDGQAFSGRAVKPSTGDLYPAGSGSNPYLTLVYGDDTHTFYITIYSFNKQPGTYTLDGKNGKSGYALFVNDDATGQWTNTSNVSVTVTSFTNNVAEGTFSFTLTGAKNKVFTNGKFRSKVVVH